MEKVDVINRTDLFKQVGPVNIVDMSTRRFLFSQDEFYHLYNRGNSKQKVFLDESDYKRFVTLLYVSNSTEAFKLFFIRKPYEIDRGDLLVSIAAYCLMPNHFHILITPMVEDGVSLFMKKLTTGYSMYFNNKYDRTGSLFEGRFKAKHVADDEYLKYLYSYIHLNPVKLIQPDWKEVGISDKGKAKKFIREYKYSSYVDYLKEKRKERLILNTSQFPKYFDTQEDFETSVFDWFEDDMRI